ncbi:MAG: hypothetical protein GY720_14495 [bacterium]|nr:hypothetical protein [bacterium]
MTDEAGASGADAPKESGAGDAVQKAMADITSGMNNAEKMIALGAVLFLAICAILGDLILDDYGTSGLELILAGGALLVILRHNKGNSPWHSLYPWIAEALAGAYAAIGVFNFVDWLLDGFDGLDGSYAFYTLVFWASVALLGYGSWQLHRAHD